MRSAVAILALVCCASLAAAGQIDSIPVVGSIRGEKAGGFTGKLKITKALRETNTLHLAGQIYDGVLTLPDGTTKTVDTIVLGTTASGRKLLQLIPTLPVTSITGTCDILHLSTGAINLDLLGLVVDLAPINLDIVAQSGAGNLLGNLLCAVANLLNGGLNLNALVIQLNTLLNNLLGALGR